MIHLEINTHGTVMTQFIRLLLDSSRVRAYNTYRKHGAPRQDAKHNPKIK